MGLLRRLFYGRDLREVLDETRIVFVHGVKFWIKRIDPIAHLDGSKVMLQYYDEYKIKSNDVKAGPDQLKQLREHYRDIFLASVVYPKIVRKKEDASGDEIFVDHLMTDWGLATELYAQIILYANGKKKLKKNLSLAPSF